MKPQETSALSDLKKVLKERIGDVRIVVFGSKARGDDSPDSDIDVMLVVEDYTSEVESVIDEAIYDVNLSYDCFISAVIFGRRELEEGPLSESPLYKRAQAEGIPF